MNTRPFILAAAGIALWSVAALGAAAAPERNAEKTEGQPEKSNFQGLLAPKRVESDGVEERRTTTDARPEGRRLKVAVLDFFESTPYTKTKGSLGHAVALSLAQELDKSGRFEVFAREDLDNALGELRIEPGSLVTEPTAARVGKMAKVDYVIFGDIDKLEVARSDKNATQTAKVNVNYRILSSDSGRVWKEKELSASALGAQTDDSRDLTERAIQRTIEDFVKLAIPEPTGKVALIDSDKGLFAINLGEGNGITKGSYFQVVRLGREIRDPDSGKLIEREREVICWGRVTQVNDRTAWLEPGEYKRNDIGVVRWKTRRTRLDEVRVGDVVQVADGRKTLY